jgi:tetratricopeptide (TPR) repeat protein
MGIVDNLEAMLARGQDSALLRFSLGSEYLKLGQLEKSLVHLQRAVELDPGYSAAWKLYGKALLQAGRAAEAVQVFDAGIQAARERGDVQAAKEMEVFRRRAARAPGDSSGP